MNEFKGCVICYPNENLFPGEQIGTVCPTCRKHAEIGRRVEGMKPAKYPEGEGADMRYGEIDQADGYNRCLREAKGEKPITNQIKALAAIVKAQVLAQGYTAENQQRVACGHSMAFHAVDFEVLVSDMEKTLEEMPRKCKVKLSGKEFDAVFHGFFQVDAGPGDAGPLAVVELQDGTVTTFDPSSVRFEVQP